MDCTAVLEMLDCVRPNSDDLLMPEFDAARAHLEQCEACRCEFAERQQFDLHIASRLQDVGVPDDLKDQVLVAVTSPALCASEDVRVEQRTVSSRQRSIWPRITIAIAAAVMMAVLLWPPSKPSYTVEQVLSSVRIDLGSAAEFDGGFASQPPPRWTSSARLTFVGEARGQDLDGHAGHELACRVFVFQRLRDVTIQGLLVAMPQNRVSPLPQSASFSAATPRYVTKENQRFVVAAWQESGLVYFCLLPDSTADLEILQRALQQTTA